MLCRGLPSISGLLPGSPFEGKSLEDIIKSAEGGMFNNAAQIWNHSFYWKSMKPGGGGPPTGAIKERINQDFGDFDKFKAQFSAAAAGHFGSGWAWLILGKDGTLKIHQTHDAATPIRDNVGLPLLTCDVWEHAYYIDYRNNRPEYVKAWWNVINWDFANENLAKSCK
eukprot:GHVT01068358.1.p2 GENE.GHVT01068358.1~~GHVT01068358.1.p2  ORF type:complete len:168 (+),score=9.80 GHVT01068358.1:661-1164(+)